MPTWRRSWTRSRIDPALLHGAEIETYGDHRIAMRFGMLGLRAWNPPAKSGVRAEDFFPNFFAQAR